MFELFVFCQIKFTFPNKSFLHKLYEVRSPPTGTFVKKNLNLQTFSCPEKSWKIFETFSRAQKEFVRQKSLQSCREYFSATEKIISLGKNSSVPTSSATIILEEVRSPTPQNIRIVQKFRSASGTFWWTKN